MTHTNQMVRVNHDRKDGFYECTKIYANEPVVVHRTYLTPMAQIPSKHKEHQFHQVAEHLGAALDAFPNAVQIDPSPLAIDTMARKLREAIVAKNKYSWKHPAVNEEKWTANQAALVVSINGSKILIGPLDAVRKQQFVIKAVAAAPVAEQPSTSVIDLVGQSEVELEHVCLLLHLRRMRPAPVFQVYNLTEDQIESLERRYDIAIVPLESNPSVFQIMS